MKRVLKSGLFPDGHVVPYRVMPWGGYTAWSEEDLHAIVVYLRHLRPVAHAIPDPAPASRLQNRALSKKPTAAATTARRDNTARR